MCYSNDPTLGPLDLLKMEITRLQVAVARCDFESKRSKSACFFYSPPIGPGSLTIVSVRVFQYCVALLVSFACTGRSLSAQTFQAQIGYGQVVDTVTVTYSGGCSPSPPFNYTTTENVTARSLRSQLQLLEVNGHWQPASVTRIEPTEINYPNPVPVFRITSSINSAGIVTTVESGGPFTYMSSFYKTVYQSVSVTETINLNSGAYSRVQDENWTIYPLTTQGCQSPINEHGVTTDKGNLAISLIPVSPTSLSITTSALQAGTFQEADYSSQIAATGGTPPYGWSSSPLPNGLSLMTNPDLTGGLTGSFEQDAEDTTSTYFPPPSAFPSTATFDRLKRQFQITFTVTDVKGATASKSMTMDWTCGGDGSADDLIQQYLAFTVAAKGSPRMVPRCMDVTPSSTGGTNPAHSKHYTFSQLNVSNQSVPNAALLSTSLLYGTDVSLFLGPPLANGPGLDGLVDDYGSIPPLTSGFRPPTDQQNVYAKINANRPANDQLPVPPGGRHMFGDAVDLAVSNNSQAMWNAISNAALDAGAQLVENVLKKYPCGPVQRKCVHADWRDWTKTYAQ